MTAVAFGASRVFLPRNESPRRAAPRAARQLTAPDVVNAHAPADGDIPGGRFVVPDGEAGAAATPTPADPAVYGEGLAHVLDRVAALMPKAEVEAVWSFPGVRREGREHGVAVIARRLSGERHQVYRARYVLQLKGQDRGRWAVELEETAEAPAALLPEVIEGVRRRADEAGEAALVDLGPWRAEPGGHAGP